MPSRFLNPLILSIAAFLLTFPIARLAAQTEPSDRDGGVWFDDVSEAKGIARGDGMALARMVAANLFGDKSLAEPLTSYMKEDRSPRIVFLSVADGKQPARVFLTAGKGFVNAAIDAIRQARRLEGQGFQLRWMKFDMVLSSHEEEIGAGLKLEADRSLWGLAFDRNSGIAILPEELVARGIIDSEQKIRPGILGEFLKEGYSQKTPVEAPALEAGMRVRRFHAVGFFSEGTTVDPLYRGHRIFESVTKEQALEAARRAGQYLARAVLPNGKFIYSYLPKTDRERDQYNILRHAGSIYSMLELYGVTGKETLLAAAKRAMRYLVGAIREEVVGGRKVAVVVEDEEVKLGGNALAILALDQYARVTGDLQYVDLTKKLGRWILSVQAGNGKFTVHKQTHPGGEVSDFESNYYPGEALLALARLDRIDPEGGWIQAAEKGAVFLIQRREDASIHPKPLHDHWLLYALNEIYPRAKKPEFLAHAMSVALAIIQSQNRSPQEPDGFGSYYHPPGSTSTAIRSEGLGAAYFMARDFGSPLMAAQIRPAIERGLRFQLQTQFGPESALYLPDPWRCLGGFHHGLKNYEIRIDYVQHNLSSLLAYRRILIREEKDPIILKKAPAPPKRPE